MVTTEGKTVSKGARTLACEGPASVAIPRPCWWHWAQSPLCECVPGLHVLLSIGCDPCRESVLGGPPSHHCHSCSGDLVPTCAGSFHSCSVLSTKIPASGFLEFVTLSLALNYCGCRGALLGVNDHTCQLFGSIGDHGLCAERGTGLQCVL